MPFQTPRLLIRPFVLADLAALHRIYGDPEVMRHVDGSYDTLADTEAALRTHISSFETDGFAFMAVLAGDDLVGEVGFGRLGDDIEMGWTFRRDAWGLGYATEAGRAALSHAPSPHVLAVIRPENRASARVAEKLGFVLQGEAEVRGNTQLLYTRGPNVPE